LNEEVSTAPWLVEGADFGKFRGERHSGVLGEGLSYSGEGRGLRRGELRKPFENAWGV